jgi:hypothetical protein
MAKKSDAFTALDKSANFKDFPLKPNIGFGTFIRCWGECREEESGYKGLRAKLGIGDKEIAKGRAYCVSTGYTLAVPSLKNAKRGSSSDSRPVEEVVAENMEAHKELAAAMGVSVEVVVQNAIITLKAQRAAAAKSRAKAAEKAAADKLAEENAAELKAELSADENAA